MCDRGLCVSSPTVPTDVTDDCPLGDRAGTFDDTGLTCAQYTNNDPGSCYSQYVEKSCCASCGTHARPDANCRYGDRGPFCSTMTRYDCYQNENYCCGTCPALKNTSLPQGKRKGLGIKDHPLRMAF